MADDRLGPIIETAVDRLVSTAAASGYFDRTQSHEPKSHPGTGLTFATWVINIKPIALHSGLAATACRVPMMCRIYRDADGDPADRIDTELAVASAYLLNQLTGDFGIDGAWIDLLGAHGDPLGTDLGYVPFDDDVFRIADTMVPFICADVFDQGE